MNKDLIPEQGPCCVRALSIERALRPGLFLRRCLQSLLAGGVLWLAEDGVRADGVSTNRMDPGELSLEQLINLTVTSVSKKETDLFASPAAIYVITQDDIRRSGMTTLPELLRQVPGMDVARINGNEWAVSSRGFNNAFGNKMLVLIDGRSVYSPSSAGVFWNVQDVVLEDVDRIEAIRGPGATLWGANAVNGVINIITKSAKDTQGGLVSTAVGTEEQPTTTVRYGGQAATNLFYRAYVKYFNREGLVTAAGAHAPDDWNALRGGFRLDWEPADENKFTLQGDAYDSDAGKPLSISSLTPPYFHTANVVDHNNGGNLLGRWTHIFSDTSEIALQAYYNHVREDLGPSVNFDDTCDVDLQHHFALGDRNDITWGAGYRDTTTKDTSTFGATWGHDRHRLQLFNVFAQDDFTLVRDRLHFVAGSKIERNNLTGLEFEPNARLLWTPTSRQTVWAAVSRAVRTPSFVEEDARFNVAAAPGVLVTIFGNPSVESEKLTAYELGYRIEPLKQLSFDLSAYYNVYDHLIDLQGNPPRFEASPAPPHLLISQTWQDKERGDVCGAELSAQWQVTEHWRLVGSYTWLHINLTPDALAESQSPQQQFQIRSYLDLPHHIELSGAVYYVNPITVEQDGGTVSIPSCFRLDLGIGWHPIPSLEIGIWGQNLLDDRHGEFSSPMSVVNTEVPRSVLAKVTWKF